MKKLTETSRSTAVTASAKNGEYEYGVNYNFVDGGIVKLQCDVTKVTDTEDMGGQRTYAGSMSLIGGTKTMNFPESEETDTHIAMFKAIIAEIKEEIGA